MYEDRLPITERQLEEARRIVERQRQIVSRQQVLGVSTAESEGLLAEFERSQAIFEEDLAAIRAKRK